MMFRPEVPMTSRKAVLEEMGRLVIESPPLRTSSGPSKYCADPNGRDILATPEEIAAARCGDCKKLSMLAARRAIDAGAKRVELAMTVTDEPDEHVFIIVDGEFRDPAREVGMPCRIIDLFIPVTIWPLAEFGRSEPPSKGTVEQIRKAAPEESPMLQEDAELFQAYGADFMPEHRSQGAADILANMGLINPWNEGPQTQWNVDPAHRAGAPGGAFASQMQVPGAGLPPATPQQGPVFHTPSSPVPLPAAVTPQGPQGPSKAPGSSPAAMVAVGQMPPAPSMSPAPQGPVFHPPSSPVPLPAPVMPQGQGPSKAPGMAISPAALAAIGPMMPSPAPSKAPAQAPSKAPTPTQAAPSAPHGPWKTLPVTHPPVEGVTRNGGSEVWQSGAWVPTRPGRWRDGEFRDSSDGHRLIFRRGDWVRGDEVAQVVIFSDGSFRIYYLDGRWGSGYPGDPYPRGPIFYDVATMPLGSRFSLVVFGVDAYRLDSFTQEYVKLGQLMPNGNILVGAILYHPRPDGTLEWVGPPALGLYAQADANLYALQEAIVQETIQAQKLAAMAEETRREEAARPPALVEELIVFGTPYEDPRSFY